MTTFASVSLSCMHESIRSIEPAWLAHLPLSWVQSGHLSSLWHCDSNTCCHLHLALTLLGVSTSLFGYKASTHTVVGDRWLFSSHPYFRFCTLVSAFQHFPIAPCAFLQETVWCTRMWYKANEIELSCNTSLTVAQVHKLFAWLRLVILPYSLAALLPISNIYAITACL